MNKTIAIWIGIFALGIHLFSSCSQLEEDYSINPSHTLSFSNDTISFDTIFTSVGTATKKLMIYNHFPKALNIESVLLANTEESGFRINVDGRQGDKFRDIEILSGDSLYVFVEVTIDPNGNNQPLLVEDSIIFEINGNKQNVLLQAFGQDVHLLKDGTVIEADEVFTADKPYLIYDSLVITPESKLTLMPGTQFYMHDKAYISVKGTIIADGSLSQPITFRGDRLDFVLENILPYDRTPGQWNGIVFEEESYGNIFNHVELRNVVDGILLKSSDPERMKLSISNSKLTNAVNSMLSSFNAKLLIVNTEISNAGLSLVSLNGGSYDFVHSTLANYMKLETRLLPTISMKTYEDILGNSTPLTMNFDNCIIDGSFSAGTDSYKGELNLPNAGENDGIHYRFNHCVIKCVGQNNDNFIEVQFEESPIYKSLGSNENKHFFDFRLDTIASVGAVGADKEVSKLYPLDRLGVERTGDNIETSIGAYQFIAE